MTAPVSDAPLAPFDDCRAALSFALNAHQVTAPTAYMNKAMAEVRIELKARRKKKGDPTEAERLGELLGPDAMTADQLLELEKAARRKRGGSLVRPHIMRWRDGLEKAGQAGIILHHFGYLDRPHQVVLSGLLITSHSACSCRSPCCSGWRVNERWQNAVYEMCALLQHVQVVETEPGKKGLSSQPQLRRIVVEHFFLRKELGIQQLSRETQVSYTTAAKHRGLIQEFLARCEEEAWTQLAPIFDRAGITGHHL